MIHDDNTSHHPSTIITPERSNLKVKYVLLAHVSGDQDRLSAIRATWFKSVSDDLGLMFIAGERCGTASSDPIIINSPAVASGAAFDTTKQAFANALGTFPFAEIIAKFDDDSYVYTRELIRRIVSQNQGNNDTGQYWGYPMQYNSNLQYASGGAGYVLNRRAAQDLSRCSPPADTSGIEDVSVGHCMLQVGVGLEDLIGLHPHHPYQMIRWDKTGHPHDRVHRREPVEGYMNPLSYHYMLPGEMLKMHDNIYLHGFPLKRSVPTIPKIMHQFWEGGDERKPHFLLQKCKEVHSDWEHIVWDDSLIRSRFPSGENPTCARLDYQKGGDLANMDFYMKAQEKNLLSDIARYEFLMFFGGLYVDADTECFRPVDALLEDMLSGGVQGLGFLEKDLEYHGGLLASGVIGTFPFSPLSVVLVSELQYVDWSQKAWISAGPMYFTGIVKRFKNSVAKSSLPAFWDVEIGDSIHVYPYHHSDKRPPNLYQELLLNGAVMDQKWGTTHMSYKHDNWKQAHSRVVDGLTDETLDIIARYMLDIHEIGLSTLAKTRPRWVIAGIDPSLPVQNLSCAIKHIISTWTFAMATGRVLLFDFQNQDLQGGRSQFSLTDAIHQFGLDSNALPQTVVREDQADFRENLRHSDLDTIYTASIIRIDQGETCDHVWGALTVSNELYKDYVFHNMSFKQVFMMLSKYLFQNNHNNNDYYNIDDDNDGSYVLPPTIDGPLKSKNKSMAFVYLTMKASEAYIVDLQRSIFDLNHNLKNKQTNSFISFIEDSIKAGFQLGGNENLKNTDYHHNHPVVLMVDDAAKWRYLQFVVEARIHVVQLGKEEYARILLEKASGKKRWTHSSLARFNHVIPLDLRKVREV